MIAGAGDALFGRERRALVDRRFHPALDVEEDTPVHARRTRCAAGERREGGLLQHADPPNSQIHEFDRFVFRRETVSPRVRRLEGAVDLLARRGIERPVGDGNRQLVVLSLVAQVCRPYDPPAVCRHVLAVEPAGGGRPEFGACAFDCFGGGDLQRLEDRGHEVGAQVGVQQTVGAQYSRIGRHDDALDCQITCDIGCMQRPRTAKGEQRERGRIVATLQRNRPDCPDDVGAGDADDAERRFVQIEPEARGQIGDALLCKPGIDRHPSVQQRLAVEATDQNVRVGYRRFRASHVVARGPRRRAGTLGTHLQEAVHVDPGDRAAARADRVDVERRYAQREARERTVLNLRRRSVPQQAHVRAGTADIEGDHIRKACGPGASGGTDDPCGGPESAVRIGRRRAIASDIKPPAL